jgi:hypothetical protein
MSSTLASSTAFEVTLLLIMISLIGRPVLLLVWRLFWVGHGEWVLHWEGNIGNGWRAELLGGCNRSCLLWLLYHQHGCKLVGKSSLVHCDLIERWRNHG